MANTSIYAAFERMWQHIIAKIGTVETEVTTHTSNNDIHVTAAEKENWNSIEVPSLDEYATEEYVDAAIAVAKPDWNQNDETQADYIKNRTHWIGEKIELVIQETSATDIIQEPIFVAHNDEDGVEPKLDFKIIPNDAYIVTVNGVEYRVYAHEWKDPDTIVHTFIGDSRLMDNYQDEFGTFYNSLVNLYPQDVPFAMIYHLVRTMADSNGDTYQNRIMIFGAPENSIIKIEHIDPTQHTYYPLNENFIPDTIARTTYVDEQIAAIPVPDVSGQINIHNTDATAHADIRAEIDTIIDAKSDWNQNDETQADYIKNRPFYSEGLVTTEVLPECQLTRDDASGVFISANPVSLVLGKTYIVNYNGTEYSCITSILADVDVIYLGNGTLLNMSVEDTGEPFLIVLSPGEGITIFPSDNPTTISISIYYTSEAIHHLDPKYIKDMYYSESTMQTLIEEQTVSGFTLMENTTIYIVENPFEFIPVEGNTYKIIWDGTTYECKCGSENGMLYIGNVNYVNVQSGGDIPFAILYDVGWLLLVTESTDESHTISINTIVKNIHYLDSKYIKDMYREIIVPNTKIVDNFEFTEHTHNAEVEINSNLVVGQPYTVTWDGTTYSNLVCFNVEGYETPALGNLDSEDTTYPFTIVQFENYLEIFGTSPNLTHTISIIGPAVVDIKKINEKYLPFTTDDITTTAQNRVNRHNTSTTAHETLFKQKADKDHLHSAILETNKGLEQKFWRGTQEEYDAIETKDENTMYIITDDEGGSGGSSSSTRLPSYTTEDEGKFLRIVSGAPAWATVANAEEASF